MTNKIVCNFGLEQPSQTIELPQAAVLIVGGAYKQRIGLTVESSDDLFHQLNMLRTNKANIESIHVDRFIYRVENLSNIDVIDVGVFTFVSFEGSEVVKGEVA